MVASDSLNAQVKLISFPCVCMSPWVCACLPVWRADSLPYFLETRSLSESGAHPFGYTGWPLSSRDLPVSTPSPGVAVIQPHAWSFMWIQTQVLMLAQQAFCGLLSSQPLLFLNSLFCLSNLSSSSSSSGHFSLLNILFSLCPPSPDFCKTSSVVFSFQPCFLYSESARNSDSPAENSAVPFFAIRPQSTPSTLQGLALLCF